MCKTHKKEPFPLLEPLKGTQPCDNILIGKNPLFLEGVQLEVAGVERTTPLKAIRSHCIDCCAGASAELQHCLAMRYALWHRMTGANSFQRRR